MKIELHRDEAAAAREQSLGNEVRYPSRGILPIHPENFHRLIFSPLSDAVTRSCRLQLLCFITALDTLLNSFLGNGTSCRRRETAEASQY